MQPATFSEYFDAELSKRIAREPTDRARIAVLAQQYGVWTSYYAMFAAFGRQPFNSPHPVYGNMTAFDFANVLATIRGKRAEIERAVEVA